MRFPFTSLLVYSFSQCASQVVILFQGESYAVRTRMNAAFAIGLVTCLALVLVSIAGHVWSESVVVCAVCLIAVVLLAMSTALLQTTLLGIAGAMGPELSGAAMVGLGVSGLISLGISLCAQSGERLVGGISQATGAAGAIAAAVLFAACFGYTLFSVWVYFVFLSKREPETSAALVHLEEQRDARRSFRSEESNDATGRGLLALREIAPQALNVWGVFVVTFIVFPGVLTQWAPGSSSAFQGSEQLFGTLLIGVFQVFDVLSRMAAGWGAKRIAARRLWVWVLLRLVFIPAFVLGQRRPEACILWGSDLGRFILAAGLAFTNGLLASCAMMFGPERAAPGRREAAGIVMSCVMVVGILVGTLLALLTQLGNNTGMTS